MLIQKKPSNRFLDRAAGLPLLGRRLFFRHLTAAVSGYFLLPGRPGESVARAASAPIATAERVIFIFLNGAPSHVDTFDLKEGPWTPAFMAPTSYNGLRFPQGLMPNLAETIQDLALVRSLRARATAHPLAQTWAQIGRNPIQGLNRIAPHIGAVVAYELGSAQSDQPIPPFVSLNAQNGPGASFLPPANAPFYVAANGAGLPNTAHFDGSPAFARRLELAWQLDSEIIDSQPFGARLQDMDQFRSKASGMMYNSTINSIFTFDQATRVAYGNSTFGNACVVARNLLRANLGARFIQISFGSWDHHGNIYAPNANLQLMTRQFDNGLGALIRDLKQDGTFDSTLIVALGEFGRTVGRLNANNGRDHHLQQAALLAGARIRGGRAIGATNEAGDAVAETGWSQDRPLWPEDMEATLYSALGIDWTKIIQGDALGRGFEYVPRNEAYEYEPLHELW
jgi:hypothetical protein